MAIKLNPAPHKGLKRAIWALLFMVVVGSGIFLWFGFRADSVALCIQGAGFFILGSVHVAALRVYLWRLETSSAPRSYTRPLLILGMCVGFFIMVGGFIGRQFFSL